MRGRSNPNKGGEIWSLFWILIEMYYAQELL